MQVRPEVSDARVIRTGALLGSARTSSKGWGFGIFGSQIVVPTLIDFNFLKPV